jgi:hypothetical protein
MARRINEFRRPAAQYPDRFGAACLPTGRRRRDRRFCTLKDGSAKGVVLLTNIKAAIRAIPTSIR